MTDQKIIQTYVHEVVTLNAEIASLKRQLAEARQQRDDALTLAAGYRAEVEQVKAELAARIELLEFMAEDGR